VYERAPEPREVGAGIALGANAMMALQALDAAAPIAARGDTITAADLLDHRGRLLLHTPVAEIERDLPAHSMLIHRAELLDALLSELRGDVVRFGRACTSVSQDGTHATAHFADGSTANADILVGADGIRSVVRASLLGDTPTRYAGYTGWRGMAPAGAALVPAGRTCELWGRAARFGYGRCGGERIYWYATLTTPAGGRDEADPRPALQRIFGAWASPVPDLIRVTPADAVLRNDIIDRPPVRRWGDGRITLLGDAAHPTTPNLGQGACMAIEDGVTLAHGLKGVTSGEQIERALRTYERGRMERTAMITNASWRLGRLGQWGSPLAIRVRDAVLACTPRFVVERQVRGLVGHRVGV
jgi:2-polyprenyl-6-methoxyphenol hydroxylase-like FAD-dependent oxidoreductase